MQEIVLDLDNLEVYEAGAVLVAILAHPKDEPDEMARAELHRALCALAIRAKAEAEPDWANLPQPIKPLYASCTDEGITRPIRTLERRLRDRMVAARMAIAFLKEAATGEMPKLPEGIKRLSINQLAELVLDDVGQSDPENVESRIWRPSLPVIHLAAAVQLLLHGMDRQVGYQASIGDLMMIREVIEWVIRTAQEYEGLLQRSTQLKIAPGFLIQIRLATH